MRTKLNPIHTRYAALLILLTCVTSYSARPLLSVRQIDRPLTNPAKMWQLSQVGMYDFDVKNGEWNASPASLISFLIPYAPRYSFTDKLEMPFFPFPELRISLIRKVKSGTKQFNTPDTLKIEGFNLAARVGASGFSYSERSGLTILTDAIAEMKIVVNHTLWLADNLGLFIRFNEGSQDFFAGNIFGVGLQATNRLAVKTSFSVNIPFKENPKVWIGYPDLTIFWNYNSYFGVSFSGGYTEYNEWKGASFLIRFQFQW